MVKSLDEVFVLSVLVGIEEEIEPLDEVFMLSVVVSSLDEVEPLEDALMISVAGPEDGVTGSVDEVTFLFVVVLGRSDEEIRPLDVAVCLSDEAVEAVDEVMISSQRSP